MRTGGLRKWHSSSKCLGLLLYKDPWCTHRVPPFLSLPSLFKPRYFTALPGAATGIGGAPKTLLLLLTLSLAAACRLHWWRESHTGPSVCVWVFPQPCWWMHLKRKIPRQTTAVCFCFSDRLCKTKVFYLVFMWQGFFLYKNNIFIKLCSDAWVCGVFTVLYHKVAST